MSDGIDSIIARFDLLTRRMAAWSRRDYERMNRRQRKQTIRRTHWFETDGETPASKPKGLTAARDSFLRHYAGEMR